MQKKLIRTPEVCAHFYAYGETKFLLHWTTNGVKLSKKR
jgi:hypothetical protein